MSADPLGELVEIFHQARKTTSNPNIGVRERVAIEAVERAVNKRWLEWLPSGSLVCGCGDIVQTDYDCDTCRIFGQMAEPEHLQRGRERVAAWVWCSEVYAVMTNDGCAMDNRHEPDCPCENRYPLAIVQRETP